MNACRWKWVPGSLLAIAVMTATAVRADTFGPVHYDPKRDQIIVTMIYDGTNPNAMYFPFGITFTLPAGQSGQIQLSGGENGLGCGAIQYAVYQL